MSRFPLLFDLGTQKPTTRDIANTVKAGGSDALTEAERRADQARYQEVTCRSALNRVKGMPFEWTLNPYRGCTHGCHYCFARARTGLFGAASAGELSANEATSATSSAVMVLRIVNRPPRTPVR